MNPYRANTAPPVDLWDGTCSASVVYVGSPTSLVVASNGRVYDRRTRERVFPKPLKALLQR